MTDTIADLLTRLRNAQSARKETVKIPYSKLKEQILVKLKENGFIANYTILKGDSFDNLEVDLDLDRNYPVTFTRISKSGQRIYRQAKELRTVKNGLGIEILSTSKGVITNEEAKKENVGGEVLCLIY